MKIGLRTIKTGIAVTLALMVVQIFRLESVIFISIAALIGMKPTISDSWKVGAYRIFGTIVGAFFGVLMALVFPSHFLLAGLGIVLLILVMNRLEISEGITISGVVFISIYMNHQADVNLFAYALSRLTDTFLGLTIALLVNYFILPPKYDRRAMSEMQKDISRILSCQNQLLGFILGREQLELSDIDAQIEGIYEEIIESKNLAEMQEKEEKLNVYGQVLCKEINLVLRITTDMYQHLKNLYGLVEKGISPHTTRLVKREITLLYDKLKEEEAFLQTGSPLRSAALQDMLEDVMKLKERLKSQEVSQQMEAEEIVQLMVLAYNLGEIISKIDLVTSQRYA
jgi:uncharacterized membrane protein YgaE (UPF0421/DUF939 family)